MKLSKVLRGFKPLAVVGEMVILGRGRRLFRASLELTDLQFVAQLPTHGFRQRFAGIRAIDRVLRLSISTLVAVSTDIAFAVTRSEIWRVELKTGKVTLDFTIPNGRKALNLTVLDHPTTGGRAVFFGEYFMSKAGPTARLTGPGSADNPVRIWFRSIEDAAGWKVFAEFPADEIDHTHNVVATADCSDIFVLMGDLGPGVGIWKWNAATNRLAPFQTGRQINRSTWAIVQKDRLVYATDTQLEQNHLVESALVPNAEPKLIAPIAGSSIYSAFVPTGVVFSSSIEPGMPTGNRLRDIFERVPGPGINGTRAMIYMYELASGELSQVFLAEKDAWPMRLGQFGTFMFPTGMEKLADRIFAYGNAVRGYDNCCLMFRPD